MDELIILVRTYRISAGLAERSRLAEEIFRLIEPDLRLFVFSGVSNDAAQDALQEVLKAVATGMGKFQGGTVKEFWAWCYRIARNKLNDHYRSKAKRPDAAPATGRTLPDERACKGFVSRPVIWLTRSAFFC
jgi:DNA-directed RNA polymerase specialized sigma24 family protein